MIRFLHLSDLHLNYTYSQLDLYAKEQCQEGLIDAFEKSIEFSIESGCHLVLVAGDLIDYDYIAPKLHRRLLNMIKHLIDQQIHFIYCTGNHDPKNPLLFTEEVLKNSFFHIFDQYKIAEKTLKLNNGEGVKIVSCGHENHHEPLLPIDGSYKKPKDGLTTLGVFHSSVVGSKNALEKEVYMPVELKVLENLEYDYIALGHIHKKEKLSERIYYSGNIQGLTRKETGPKGGYLVELDEGTMHQAFIAFNEVVWENVNGIIQPSMTTLQSIETYLLEQIKQMPLMDKKKKKILTIRLSGETTIYDALSEKAYRSYLKMSLSEATGAIEVNIVEEDLRRTVKFDKEKIKEGYLQFIVDFTDNMTKDASFLETLKREKGLEEIVDLEAYLNEHYLEIQNELMNRFISNEGEQ